MPSDGINLLNFLTEIQTKAEKGDFLPTLQENFSKSKYICIFGTGHVGYFMAKLLKKFNIKVDFFCDNDPQKWGKDIFDNVRCVPLGKLKDYQQDVTVLVATQYYKEIMKQLNREGFSEVYHLISFNYVENNIVKNDPNRIKTIKDKVLNLADIVEDEKSRTVIFQIVKGWFARHPSELNYENIYEGNQYFPVDIIKMTQNEVFVDAGSYDGGITLEFLKNSKEMFRQVYSFELDKNNYGLLKQNVANLRENVRKKIKLYNIGLWNCPRSIHYSGLSNQASRVDEDGDVTGNVDCLDNILGDVPITFIKMDIEGAELKALQGAENIIRNYQPKLAISVYHSIEQLWEVPLYIKSMFPEYKIYLRHHTLIDNDTVCYAIK